jgi:glutaredoxin 2
MAQPVHKEKLEQQDHKVRQEILEHLDHLVQPVQQVLLAQLVRQVLPEVEAVAEQERFH